MLHPISKAIPSNCHLTEQLVTERHQWSDKFPKCGNSTLRTGDEFCSDRVAVARANQFLGIGWNESNFGNLKTLMFFSCVLWMNTVPIKNRPVGSKQHIFSPPNACTIVRALAVNNKHGCDINSIVARIRTPCCGAGFRWNQFRATNHRQHAAHRGKWHRQWWMETNTESPTRHASVHPHCRRKRKRVAKYVFFFSGVCWLLVLGAFGGRKIPGRMRLVWQHCQRHQMA